MRIFFSRFSGFSRFGGVVGIFVGFGGRENIFWLVLKKDGGED